MWKRLVYFCSILIFFLFIGIYYGYSLVKENRIESDNYSNKEYINDSNKDLINVSTEEEKIKIDTVINFKKIYNKCNHIENTTEKVSEEIINMKEDEAKEYFLEKGYLLLDFNSEEINLVKDVDERCNEHFIIKFGSLDDEFLSIYRLDEEDELCLYRETDIAKEYLTEIDNKNFEEGISVYGKENVETVLEDYE